MNQDMTDLALIKKEIIALRGLRDDDRNILVNIENTLIGNKMNGNKGVVDKIDNLDQRIKILEVSWSVSEVYQKQMKFIVGGIVVILLSIFIQSVWNGRTIDNVEQEIKIKK